MAGVGAGTGLMQDVEGGQAKGNELPFIGVGRVKGAIALASLGTEQGAKQAEIQKIFTKMLISAKKKLKPGSRTRLSYAKGFLACMVDAKGELLCLVVASSENYPEKFAYQLLQEVLSIVQESKNWRLAQENELNEALEPQMKRLLEKYEDTSNFDNFSRTLKKISMVKSQMSDNMTAVSNNAKSLQVVNNRAQEMEDKAKVFHQTSKDVHWKYLLELHKQRILTYGSVAVVGGGLVWFLLH